MNEVLGTLAELKKQGKRLVGCFPLYPPLEILHSFGLTPVTLWGLGSDVSDFSRSDRHLQNYTCSVARCLTEFVLGDASTLFSALFMYNACDTLRNLPEIIAEGLKEEGRSLPVFRLHVPAVPPERTGAQSYLKGRLTELVKDLEEFTGTLFSSDDFMRSIHLYRRQRQLCTEIEDRVRYGTIPFSACIKVLQLAHILPVEAHIPLLEKMLSGAGKNPHDQAPHAGVMVSGILTPPSALIETMEKSGLRVVANDIASLKRSYGHSPPPMSDPGDYYCDFYLNHYPCTTLLPAGDRRIELIRQTMHERGAEGFIFFGEKFCEYEYFEIPHLENILRADGVSTLCLELGVDEGESLGALRNRMDAFAEMLKGKAGQ